MSALTLRLPDDKHARLRALAKSRGTTVNRLLDEAATLLISEFDAETRFRLRAAQGAGPGKLTDGPAVSPRPGISFLQLGRAGRTPTPLQR
jgi:hypothetical protein